MTTATTNGHSATLFPVHAEELRASGLTDDTIQAAGIYSEHDRSKLARLLNRQNYPRQWGSALVIPYTNEHGAIVQYRLKPERPPSRNGKPAKYLSQTGASARVYFPPGVREKIDNGSTEVIITEGEKKGLRAAQDGYCCIALPGVDCFNTRKSTALVGELRNIEWRGRTAFVAYDSDAVDNADVRRAEIQLASQLMRCGAIVKVIRLPATENGDKVGLDDFLLSRGATALRRLMDTAEPPETPEPDMLKTIAHEADAAVVSEKFLAANHVQGVTRIRFWRGQWWLWERGGYRDLGDDDLRAKVVEFLCRDYTQVKRDHVSNVVEHLKSQSFVASNVDAPVWLSRTTSDWPALECVATESGVVHLPSYANEQPCLVPATPQFFTTACLGYPFDADAPRPVLWEKFLADVWVDDVQSVSTLREFFGYSLVPDTRQQKLLMIVGPKRSGKGTILRVWRALVGAMNVAAPTLSSLTERFGLSPLVGKSLAVVSDARLSGRADQAVITERILSITGEDAQTIDRKHRQPITLKLNTRFVIVTNELPRLGDSSGALVSRMILLHTPRSFYGCEDTDLSEKLLAELPGTLLWALAGWQSLRERGRFVQPDSSLELFQEMSDLSSPIGAFVRERCVVDPTAAVKVNAIYSEWKTWCEESGKLRPTDKATFGRDLFALAPGVRRSRPRGDDGQRTYEYEGIGLLHPSVWS